MQRDRIARTARAAAGLLAAFALVTGAPSGAIADSRRPQARSAPAHHVKAALLVNFGRFVEWPDRPDDGPFVIVVVGAPEVAASLRAASPSLAIRGRQVIVREAPDASGVEPAHLAFFGERSALPEPDVMARLTRASVLTVGEEEAFLEHGGSIRLVVVNDRLRIHVRDGAGADAGLRVSSALLDLAVIERVGSARARK